MTLILSTICNDGIAISYEDKVVDMKNQTGDAMREEKVFHIGNEIYIAFSGTWIPRKLPDTLVGFIRQSMNGLPFPYKVRDIAEAIVESFRTLPEYHESFVISCLIIGYDRNSAGMMTHPRQFAFTSENNYRLEEGSILTLGAEISENQLDYLDNNAHTTSDASRLQEDIIRDVSKQNHLVGDDAKTVRILPT